MNTVIAILVLLAILSIAIAYIISEKKKGSKCIGCPYAKQCATKHNGSSRGCND